MSTQKEVIINKTDFESELEWDYLLDQLDLVDEMLENPFDSVFLQVAVATPRR